MRVRYATPPDFSAIADLCPDAFMDDELFVYVCPQQKDYPEHFRSLFLQSIKVLYYNPHAHLLVAETEPADPQWTGRPEVVGYAGWELNGVKEPILATLSPSRVAMSIEATLLGVQHKYLWYTDANKSMSKAHMTAFRDYMRGGLAGFSGLKHFWSLEFLAVSTKFQRQGAGGQLVDWGLDKAQLDGLPAMLCASTKGQGLYRKKRFEQFAMLDSPPGGTGVAMMWEPVGMEGRFKAMRKHSAGA